MIKFDETFKPHTYDDLYDRYDRRRKEIPHIRKPLHRKIARNHLLHSLLEVSGRYKEILAPELSVAEPEYTFFHTGVELKGHDAVEGFYRGLTETGANVIVTEDHRMAIADWGFGLEQVSHFNRSGAFVEKLGLPPLKEGDVYVEHRQTMRIWPYNSSGIMVGENLYYAHEATYSFVPKAQALTPEGVAAKLAALIDIAREEYLSETLEPAVAA